MPKAYLDFRTDKSSLMDNMHENVFTITSRVDYNTISSPYTWMISLDGGMSWELDVYGELCTINKGETCMIIGNYTVIDNESDFPIFNTTGYFDVSGNIKSLNDITFKTSTIPLLSKGFKGLFKYSLVVNAENLVLPDTTLASECYKEMFYGCGELKTPPKLPATTLASECYKDMFYACYNLAYAPELPVTTLAEDCYRGMFDTCTSLKSAPKLPATIIPQWAYGYMFNGCTSLQTPPELPARTLSEFCYAHMFDGCTSLTSAPELPATTLPSYCYSYMFSGCTNLSYIKIHATSRQINSLYSWVNDVADFGIFVKDPSASYDIDSIHGVPIGWTIYNIGDDIGDMYRVSVYVKPTSSGYVIGSGLYPKGTNVTLKAIPYEGYAFSRWENSAYTMISNSNMYTFKILGDIMLYARFDEASDNIQYSSEYFAIYPEEDRTKVYIDSIWGEESYTLYYKINNGSWETTIIPQNLDQDTDRKPNLLFQLNAGDKLYLGTDRGDNFNNGRIHVDGRHKISGNILSLIAYSGSQSSTDTVFYYDSNYEILDDAFSGAFAGDTTLTDAYNLIIPNVSMHNGSSLLEHTGSFYRTFKGCTSLLRAPSILLPTTLAVNCYESMFEDCTSLVTIPELPATTLADNCYNSMFKNCSSLVTIPELPATTIPMGAYRAMFYGCSSLEYPPELPATTLNAVCYDEMFYGCKSLLEAPELPAMSIPVSAYYRMFGLCYSLAEAPALPATTLSNNCYEGMFIDCISLIEAPVLPAITVPTQAYVEMFAGCTSLSKITIYAQNYTDEYNGQTSPGMINFADHSLFWWVWNVAPTGVFIKDPDADYEIDSVNGVPPGWTIQNYDGSPVILRYLIKLHNENSSAGSVNIYTVENGDNVDHGSRAYIPAGTTVYLVATPNSGYIFSGWKNNDGTTFNGGDNSFIVSESIDITAFWNQYTPTNYTVTITNSDNNAGTVTGSGTYASGYTVNISATPNNGYRFVRYIDNDTGQTYSDANMSFIITRNRSFTVYWEEYVDYEHMYLTIENTGVSDMTLVLNIGYIVHDNIGGEISRYEFDCSFQYKKGSEYYWREYRTTFFESTNAIRYGIWNNGKKIYINIAAGDKVSLRDFIDDAWISANSSIGTIYIQRIYAEESNAQYKIYGNIMSLYSKYKGSNTTDTYYVYNGASIDNAILIPAGYYDLGEGGGTIHSDIHKGIFMGLFEETSIIDASHIILPATSLGTYCYHNMFYGCTSLTIAPELPATSLTDHCYLNMFKNCTSLIYIKAMTTTNLNMQVPVYDNVGNITHYMYRFTHNWVQNVASLGTFVKNTNAIWTLTGDSGIPTGWNVQTASS